MTESKKLTIIAPDMIKVMKAIFRLDWSNCVITDDMNEDFTGTLAFRSRNSNTIFHYEIIFI